MRQICAGDDRNWIEFRDDIRRKQVNSYADAIENNNAELLAEILREVVTSCHIIVGDEVYESIDALLDADLTEMTITIEAFWQTAFWGEVTAQRNLGNATRPG